MAKIKIAQIVWPSTTLPPKTYGSIQLIASRIIEGLDKNIFDVSVFASADSTIDANMIPICKIPVNEDPTIEDRRLYMSILLSEIFQRENDFDIIHSHIDHTTLALAQVIKKPIVMTMHRAYDDHAKEAFVKYGQKINSIAISKSQKETMPNVNITGVVYNGIDVSKHEYVSSGGNYMACVGRTTPYKGIDEAIQIAIEMKIPLKIAAHRDYAPASDKYYKEKIEPFLDNEYIDYLGEVSEEEVQEMLKNAKLFINPISWVEPFGLVVAEANASGVPVVTYDCGAMREIIEEGKTGFIVKDRNEMKEKIKAIFFLTKEEEAVMRPYCHKHIADNFSIEKMVAGYTKIYQDILNNK